MSDQHSIIEHRANYHFLMLEEDYIAICKGKHSHCKAAILSILEHWMNSKRTETSKDDDLYVYLSYPQFVKRMFNLYGRNTVIESLEELVHNGLVLKRPFVDAFNQETFEYRLDRAEVQKQFATLPDKPSGLNLNGGSLLLNYPGVEVNEGPFENKRGGSLNSNDGSFKSKRNVDTTEIPNADTTQIGKEPYSLANHPKRKTDPNLIAFKTGTNNTDISNAPTVEIPVVKVTSQHIPTSQSQAGRTPDNVAPSASAGKRTQEKVTQAELPKSPPPMPLEDAEWTTRTCLQLFDYWRGAPLLDIGQIKYANTCAKNLAQNYTREQVAHVYEAMSADQWWIDHGGVDVCEVARHMSKELNKLRKPTKKPTQRSNELPEFTEEEYQRLKETPP